MLAESGWTASTDEQRLNKPFAAVRVGDCLAMDEIQACFDHVPLDPYVEDGFRHKSIVRVRVRNQSVTETAHGPLFQPKEYNPVHGDIRRHYARMDSKLVLLLTSVVQIFAACARLRHEHEILVQAQRITASSGADRSTGFPVLEGWHRDNTRVLGLFLVNRVNVTGGISMLSSDRSGASLEFAKVLEIGELLLVDDTAVWHNTTPIAKVRSSLAGYRDVLILTWPSCREPEYAAE